MVSDVQFPSLLSLMNRWHVKQNKTQLQNLWSLNPEPGCCFWNPAGMAPFWATAPFKARHISGFACFPMTSLNCHTVIYSTWIWGLENAWTSDRCVPDWVAGNDTPKYEWTSMVYQYSPHSPGVWTKAAGRSKSSWYTMQSCWQRRWLLLQHATIHIYSLVL